MWSSNELFQKHRADPVIGVILSWKEQEVNNLLKLQWVLVDGHCVPSGCNGTDWS